MNTKLYLFKQYFKNCVRPKYPSFSNSTSLNKIIDIKDHDDFLNKVMKSDIPVVVNFHANWCEPCHILTPKLIELVSNKDDIDLVTVDVEIHAELAHTFEVKAVPAVLAVKNGLVIDKSIGLIDASMLEKMIHNIINK
ncbi:thioredoxin mitochondrial [Holotrichia oblita]|uniref:Thioredoxin mitochondrial n=1 Tax=Holotrichia oblita TaxID=644536 RepID=A0ACB9T8N4_HOLOL|nr:thioredoxin mitochondrial [Holotrichia oblita]